MLAMPLQEILESLLADLDGSRVTLRQDIEGDVFPVTHEALAAGAPSIIGVSTPNMAGQPVVTRVLAGDQIIQDDCEAEFTDDEPFQQMLGLYGGMCAQIVTPIVIDQSTKAIISLHILGHTREWTDADAERCRNATGMVRSELAPGS
jgi:GAF domain-containing protein